MNVKKLVCLLLAALLATSLCGCADPSALALGSGMIDAMRGQTMAFTFEMELARMRNSATLTLRGSGTATGLFDGDTQVVAAGEIELREKTDEVYANGQYGSLPVYKTTYYDARQIYYRGGVLYLVDAPSEAFTLLPTGMEQIELSDSLLNVFDGGTLAGLEDVTVSAIGEGRRLRCTIDPDSEMGRILVALFTSLDDGTVGDPGQEDSYRAVLTTDSGGRMEQLDLIWKHGDSPSSPEITLSIFVDGYSNSATTLTFPSYVK